MSHIISRLKHELEQERARAERYVILLRVRGRQLVELKRGIAPMMRELQHLRGKDFLPPKPETPKEKND